MNSAHAFSYAMSGSFTEQQMAQNAAHVQQNLQGFQNMGGWLGQQATQMWTDFTKFLDSRAWEMSKRLGDNDRGDYVGRFDIGYLGTVEGLLGAKGLMPNFIMANPSHMQAWLDGKVQGYEDLHHLCTGVGVNNPYYRKAMNGVLDLKELEGVQVLSHSHFTDTGGDVLPFRSIVNIQKTWAATDYHRAKGLLDIKSKEEPSVLEA